MWYLWSVPVALIVFLWLLNQHLSGRLKHAVSGALIWVAIGLIMIAFLVFGWAAGITTIVTVPISALILTPITRSLVRRSSGYSDPRIQQYGEQQVHELLTASSGFSIIETLRTRETEEHQYIEQAVQKACTQPTIKKVLAKQGGDQRDLEALYKCMEMQMLPPEMREIALSNAKLLDFFLQNSTGSSAQGEYSRSYPMRIHVVLGLWLRYDSTADEPPQF